MAGETADVRVGIVSFNTADLLDRCLGALPDALGDLQAEIVVVDNASRDDSVTVARRHAHVDVRDNPQNVGYAAAMNDALAGTAAPVLIALNPDTEPPPRSLRLLVEHLLAHPRAGLVVPRLVNRDGTLQPSVHRFPSLTLAAAANLVPARALRGPLGERLWIEGSADHRTSQPIDWAFGAVHVMRTAATGPRPYDERWFMYVEDLDLCWRLHHDGWTVELVAEVAVPHVGNAAGQQQWGDARDAQVWAATYDWCSRTIGPARTRGYAALNATGAAVKGAAQRVVGRVRHDPAMTAAGARLLATAGVHGRGLVRRRAH